MSNPLIDELVESSVIPQVEIALPTRGQFYPDGQVIAVGADPDNLVIKPISVLEESTFNDPLLLLTGHAIDKMIKRVCPAVIDPGALCELDVQAILIASRIASHGPMMKVQHTCESCGYKNDLEIDLNSHILNFDSYTPEQAMKFNVVLGISGQSVSLRPMLYKDTVDMTMSLVRSSTKAETFSEEDADTLTPEFVDMYREQFERTLDTNLKALCASIYYVTAKSGKIVTDADIITDWLTSLPMEDVTQITNRIKEINEEIRERSLMTYTCQGCGEESSFYLELDPQKLFSQAEDSETQSESSAASMNTEKPTKKTSKSSARLS